MWEPQTRTGKNDHFVEEIAVQKVIEAGADVEMPSHSTRMA